MRTRGEVIGDANVEGTAGVLAKRDIGGMADAFTKRGLPPGRGAWGCAESGGVCVASQATCSSTARLLRSTAPLSYAAAVAKVVCGT